jgi:hypothetical protein
MENFSIKALNTETWKDFERLVQKHNGVWGGCWCTAFHPKSPDPERSAEASKSYKEKLVKEDRAHAALVFDGDICVAWCQFGSPQELPNIYHRKEADFYWLATVGRHEKPHVRPLLAVWLEGALYFCAGAATRKAKNLAHNRYCTVTAVSDDAHLVVEGEASQVRDETTLQRVAERYAAKYEWPVTVRDNAFYADGAPTALRCLQSGAGHSLWLWPQRII